MGRNRQNTGKSKKRAPTQAQGQPRTFSAERIAMLRRIVPLNRERFGAVMNVDVRVLRHWESGTESVPPSAVALLEILENHPRMALVIDAQLSEPKKWRMHITKAKLQSITDDELLIDAIILGRLVR